MGIKKTDVIEVVSIVGVVVSFFFSGASAVHKEKLFSFLFYVVGGVFIFALIKNYKNMWGNKYGKENTTRS